MSPRASSKGRRSAASKKRRSHAKPRTRDSVVAVATRRLAPFPVVGIGASAGGLEAFTQLLSSLPANTGMAFVLIQHLDPQHDSLLTQALGRATKMPVVQISDGMPVEPDHVYVIPPNADAAILHGALTLLPRSTDPRRPHLPVDVFFRALAADLGNQAIGIVLSGTASDGTAGLKAIKAENGIALVQDPASAKFAGMPQSAIDAGVADAALAMLEVDEAGLDRSDRALLETVATKFGGGPVGLSTLAIAIGEEQDTIEDVFEPYLLQQGLLKRTPRGRVLTQRAYDHLGVPAPEGAASLF